MGTGLLQSSVTDYGLIMHDVSKHVEVLVSINVGMYTTSNNWEMHSTKKQKVDADTNHGVTRNK